MAEESAFNLARVMQAACSIPTRLERVSWRYWPAVSEVTGPAPKCFRSLEPGKWTLRFRALVRNSAVRRFSKWAVNGGQTRRDSSQAEGVQAFHKRHGRVIAKQEVRRILRKYKDTGFDALQDVAMLYYQISIVVRAWEQKLGDNPAGSSSEHCQDLQGMRRNGLTIFEAIEQKKRAINGKVYEEALRAATKVFVQYAGNAYISDKQDSEVIYGVIYNEAANELVDDMYDIQYKQPPQSHEGDDVGRVLRPVQQAAAALVELQPQSRQRNLR